jgi:hypothetical protein
MNSKLTRTIFFASGIGFFVLWVLEFRRTTLFESYWLLLVSLTCLLLFQFNRLKNSVRHDKRGSADQETKKLVATKKIKK